MLKQAATIADSIKADPEEIDADRRTSVERETGDELDLGSRWTPVAFTLALMDTDGEV
ncbi:MAG: hypothetical protein HY913_15180 [Desulfomonile tiedjei]|nr:hypothetical protein [Desulfomonile tiedjei]